MTDFIQRLVMYIPQLRHGAMVTLTLCVAGMAIGFVLAVLLCQLSQSRHKSLQAFCGVYCSFFRGTPLLAQLLLCFYLPTALGLDIPGSMAAIIVLAMNTSAYQSQILRSGFDAIPAGQLEAAAIFGISRVRTLCRIQLPQVLRLTLSALVSELIDVIKVSAVVSVVSVTDLMRVGQQLVSQTYRPLEVYLVTAVFYLLLTSLLSVAASLLEKRWKERYQ